MRIRLAIGIALLVVLVPVLAMASDYKFNRRVYSHIEGDSWARSGMIPFEKLLNILESADVVFLGEYHTDFYSHKMQNEILRELAKRRGGFALSMEQFERDVQPVLDSYLAGEIDEEEFLANSRPWPNYDPDYRRMVRFCRKKGFPVSASNIPRPLASKIAKNGYETAWAEYTDEERTFIAAEIHRQKDLYWENFFGFMGGGHGEGMTEELIYNYFGSQCSKDDTMAESIARLREADPDRIVVHTNGSFHCDYRLGTVSRLETRRPEDRIIVVAIRPAESWSRATLNAETIEYAGDEVPVADYIVYVEPSPEEETEGPM